MRFALSAILLFASIARADVSISHSPEDRGSVSATITRDFAWRNERNHDAAWVFARAHRVGSPWWSPVRIVGIQNAPMARGATAAAFDLPSAGLGAFVRAREEHRGPVAHELILTLSSEDLDRVRGDDGEIQVKLFAIEMVYVPQGPFWIGTADERGLDEFASFHQVGADGTRAGPMRITSEDAIDIGKGEGDLSYDQGEDWTADYEGDRRGPVPLSFPKGFNAFYIMKHEITQGQYAAFLNNLSPEETSFRAIHAGAEYEKHRGSISKIEGKYIAAFANRPANYVSWDDGCAFADWAGLRPMTELEFTKACRGPDRPSGADFPWGTTNKDRLVRVLPFGGFDLVTSGSADVSQLSDDTRDVLGTSHYWVFDLAGSVWERCVTIGHPDGRAFEGTHGDGQLIYGYATNKDWPSGDVFGGGYGYRGGGHYEADREYEDGGFNPHSPVAWRRFGAWGQAPRSKAYGFRAVRSVR